MAFPYHHMPHPRPATTTTAITNKMSLDQLLTKGPPHGNIESGLDQLRFHILTEGIPANSDGMVSFSLLHRSQLTPY